MKIIYNDGIEEPVINLPEHDQRRSFFVRAKHLFLSPVTKKSGRSEQMNNEWMIRPIRADEAAEARRLIYAVAHDLMEPQMPLEEVTAQWDAWGAFCDLDDVQVSYFENGGVFLVTLCGGQLVGTGAFHRYAEGVCELRRITLLPEYRGRGLGYAMLMELMRRARAMGYGKMCLWTNRYKLWRAVDFYHRLGFVDVPHEGADEEELWMEMEIKTSRSAFLSAQEQ